MSQMWFNSSAAACAVLGTHFFLRLMIQGGPLRAVGYTSTLTSGIRHFPKAEVSRGLFCHG